ncbi:hypothetical protein [Vibrio phage Va2]|nr:hypothetical protein [Vibrio phage Va2]
MKVLMSRDNPQGRKLEELIDDIITDLEEKNDYLREQGDSLCSQLMNNNKVVIYKLKEAKTQFEVGFQILDAAKGKGGSPLNPRV